jgi:HEAT repeat protein
MLRKLLTLCLAGAVVLGGEWFVALGDDGKGKEPVKNDDATPKQIDDLIRQLGSEDFDARDQATSKLTAIGAAALQRLRRATDNPDPEIAARSQACISIIETNEKVISLVKGFTDKSADERAKVLGKLHGCRSAAKIALPTVLAAMDDADDWVRQCAIRVVWDYGPAAEATVPKLLEIAKSDKRSESDRWYSLIAFQYIGSSAEKTVPDLLDLLQAREARIRQGAASSLGHLGKANKEVHPALLKLLKDPDLTVQGTAAASLGLHGKNSEETVPALVELLKRYKGYKGKDDPRSCVFFALEQLGASASPAIPTLVEVGEDQKETDSVRSRAVQTIGVIGEQTSDAIPALRRFAENSKEPILALMAKSSLESIQGKMK